MNSGQLDVRLSSTLDLHLAATHVVCGTHTVMDLALPRQVEGLTWSQPPAVWGFTQEGFLVLPSDIFTLNVKILAIDGHLGGTSTP